MKKYEGFFAYWIFVQSILYIYCCPDITSLKSFFFFTIIYIHNLFCFLFFFHASKLKKEEEETRPITIKKKCCVCFEEKLEDLNGITCEANQFNCWDCYYQASKMESHRNLVFKNKIRCLDLQCHGCFSLHALARNGASEELITNFQKLIVNHLSNNLLRENNCILEKKFNSDLKNLVNIPVNLNKFSYSFFIYFFFNSIFF